MQECLAAFSKRVASTRRTGLPALQTYTSSRTGMRLVAGASGVAAHDEALDERAGV